MNVIHLYIRTVLTISVGTLYRTLPFVMHCTLYKYMQQTCYTHNGENIFNICCLCIALL